MNPSRLFALQLENLNQQIRANAENSQAYANRGYTLAVLGRKEEARADIRKSVALKDTGPMHNRAAGQKRGTD
jgi:Flp pilus assembly protein TadD